MLCLVCKLLKGRCLIAGAEFYFSVCISILVMQTQRTSGKQSS